MASNAKYWTFIFWLDHDYGDWQNEISEKLQVAYAYCIHDKDVNDGDNEKRKPHVHVILAFPNTTTYNNALSVARELVPDCAIIKRVINIRYMYDYLIHNTEDCIKKNKHIYDADERVTGNCFDIGAFEQVSVAEKHQMIRQLKQFIKDNGFTNMIDFDNNVESCFNDSYQEIILGYYGFFEAFCRGNYLKEKNGR